MSDLREAARQALEALERPNAGLVPHNGEWMSIQSIAIAALRAALAQEQAEPVAWMQPRTVDGYLRPDLGYETCSSADYGAFPVYRAPPKAEQAQEPVAVVGTQVDVWRGCDGRWAPPGEPIKTALMLKDMPVGTMLYTTPPKRQPLSGLEVERLLEQVIGSLPAARNLVRAVERAHGIIEPRIEADSHQTLDDAMQQPRAMAQAYESGYKAGAAAEREAIIQAIPGGHIVDPQWVCDMIRARGNT